IALDAPVLHVHPLLLHPGGGDVAERCARAVHAHAQRVLEALVGAGADLGDAGHGARRSARRSARRAAFGTHVSSFMFRGCLNQTVFDPRLSRKLLSPARRRSSLTAMLDTLSSRGPAIGFLETSSIAKGI